jgi:hypothetical protein
LLLTLPYFSTTYNKVEITFPVLPELENDPLENLVFVEFEGKVYRGEHALPGELTNENLFMDSEYPWLNLQAMNSILDVFQPDSNAVPLYSMKRQAGKFKMHYIIITVK